MATTAKHPERPDRASDPVRRTSQFHALASAVSVSSDRAGISGAFTGHALRALLMALALTPRPGFAGSGELLCGDPLFTVIASDPRLAARGCEAAALAQDTLGMCGVRVERPLTIEVRDRLSRPDCVGIYHCGEDRIEVLEPAALDAAIGDGPFTSVNRARYWDSVVVHEVAHALYDQVDCPFAACVGTAEYVAYTMQVQSLPEPDRRAFEAAANVDDTEPRDRFSAVEALMSPGSFAGLAWAHFSQRPDPCGYLRLILDGNIYLDNERP